jgi:GNAT superfamily N-acetyltransferase
MNGMNGMDVIELHPDDLDAHGLLLAEVAELETAARAADAPWVHPSTVTELRHRIRHGFDLEPGRHFAGVVAGRAVALGVVHTSEWDNRDLAWLDVVVHPEHRRRGHGTRMAEHVRSVAERMGRPRHGCDAWDGTPGVAFAERLGFRPRSTAINRRQHPAEVSRDAIRDAHRAATEHASDYELVRLTGRTPEDLLPDLAALVESINDAPLDELEIEDEVFTPQRVRDYETANTQGRRLYRVLARHRGSGELAGHTVVVVEGERPEIGHQHDTTVARAHRGHRLGLLLKSEMNLWLAEAEPRLRTVDTWNAESNDHMIAVNEMLGYRWMGRGVQLQR